MITLPILDDDPSTVSRGGAVPALVARERRWQDPAPLPLDCGQTLTGVEVGTLLGGTVIIEYVFTWPGVSTLVITAANRRDYPAPFPELFLGRDTEVIAIDCKKPGEPASERE